MKFDNKDPIIKAVPVALFPTTSFQQLLWLVLYKEMSYAQSTKYKRQIYNYFVKGIRSAWKHNPYW